MNLSELKQELLDLKVQRAAHVKEAGELLDAGKMDDWTAKMSEVDGDNAAIDRNEAKIAALEKQADFEQKYARGSEDETGKTKGVKPGAEPQESGYQKAVKALAAAARAGFPTAKAAAGTNMTEGVPADGGYTVPEDIVNRIIARRDSKESLLTLVSVEKVTTNKGKRTFKKRGQHKGFATVAEAAKFGAMATPEFAQIAYEIEKRGGYLPVTNELLEDSDENIAALVEDWMGDEARVTANNEILTVMKSKGSTDFNTLDGIIKAWIKLGSLFRATSRLITNDDGLAWLGTLKDANGRYLLSPNPADTKELQLCVGPHRLPVSTFDNDTIPSDGTKVPIGLGDFKEGIRYWDRRSFALKTSDVAVVGKLNAFEEDLTIWRGSLRDDCTTWDDTAFVYGYPKVSPLHSTGWVTASRSRI